MDRIKIIITGASGKVGEAVTKLLSKDNRYKLYLFTSSDNELICNSDEEIVKFDLCDLKELKNHCHRIEPNFIINTAAFTNVDTNEDNKQLAQDLNSKVPEYFARYTKLFDCHLITFSTDYIFDGTKGMYLENDLPKPLSYYGKTKLQGENLVISNSPSYTILRTNVVYGKSSYGKSDFIMWVYNKLKAGEAINIIDGQYCNPTFSGDIGEIVHLIVKQKVNGIFNIAGNGYYNRYEIAMLIAKHFGLDDTLISKVPEASLVQKAKRPSKGGLDNTKAEKQFSYKFKTLEEGLSLISE